MITWVRVSGLGLPVRIRQVTAEDGGEEGEILFPSAPDGGPTLDPRMCWWNGETWGLRPSLPDPGATNLNPGVRLTFQSDQPALIRDPETGVTFADVPSAGGVVEFDLIDPGAYLIEIAPDGLVLPWAATVEVN